MDNRNNERKQPPMNMNGRGPGGGGPMAHRMQGGKRQPLNKTALKRLLKYLLNYKFSLLFVLICIGIGSVTGVIGSTFVKTLIDDYISPLLLQSAPVFDGLIKAILQMALIYVVGILATFAYTRIMVNISQGIIDKIRKEMFDHMETLPIKYFDTHSHGDIMSHYTNDADTLQQMLSQSVPQMFSAIITVVSVFVAMITTSIWLTIFVILSVFGMFQVIKKLGSKSSKFFVKQQKSLGSLNGFIEEMITGQKVVKVFCHEDISKETFDELNEELFENATEANKIANMMMPIMMNMGNIQYVLVAILGGVMASFGFGGITIGTISAFLLLSKSFIMPINMISQQMNSIIMAIAGASRIFELLDEKPEVDDGKVTLVKAKYENGQLVESTNKDKTDVWAWKHPHSDGTTTFTKLTGIVHFDDVDFGYKEDKLVLHNITLDATEGQKVAFVGATGAGKTTITNLINRFYDIADGKIRYDSININKIKKADLRRSLGVVLQDVNLFTDTIMENIRYGKLDATDEECIAAAKLANADGFIRLLPNGYNTVLSGDGAGLSQGQRQLISIARAAVADPPVMILDEATSSIDTRTELLVQDGMDSLMKGRTVFVIAHRLSTIQNSDKIMVLDLGRIIEQGNHDELIKQKGKYYQLYTGAFELD